MQKSPSPVALITNASSYVGPPLARLLASRGHALVLHAPDQGQLEALRDQGVEVECVENVDLATAEGNRRLVEASLQRFGRLDAACFVTGQIVLGPFLVIAALFIFI